MGKLGFREPTLAGRKCLFLDLRVWGESGDKQLERVRFARSDFPTRLVRVLKQCDSVLLLHTGMPYISYSTCRAGESVTVLYEGSANALHAACNTHDTSRYRHLLHPLDNGLIGYATFIGSLATACGLRGRVHFAE